MKTNFKHLNYNKRQLILLVILLSIILGISAYYINTESEKSNRRDKFDELESISKLKISQILLWKDERLGDADVISKIPFIKSSIVQLTEQTRNFKIRKNLRSLIESLVKHYNCNNIIITSIKGELLFSFDSTLKNIYQFTSAHINEAVNKDSIIFSELYKTTFNKKINLDITTPIHDEHGKIIALIILQINPNNYLFPLIQTWPTLSKTGETLIIRKDNDSVLFVNELRFLKNSALSLRISLSRKEVPAVQAILGYKGIWQGKDYRNVDVLSYISPVPGTNWFMITKIDKSEIYSELYTHEVFIAVITLVLILLLTAGIILSVSVQQKNTYKGLLQIEKELHSVENEFRTTIYSIGDGVITTDKIGKIKQMNYAAEKLTRWHETDAVGKWLYEVFKIITENNNAIIENAVEKVLKSGVATNIENHTILISKEGREIPIVSNAAPIKSEQGEIMGAVLVFKDQTKERKAQKRLAESEEKFRNLFTHLTDIVCIISQDRSIISGNPAIESMTGWQLSEWINKPFTNFIHPEDLPFAMEKFELVLNGNDEYSFEVRILCKSGNYIFCESNASFLKIDEKTIAALCTIRDITARKLAEEKNIRLSRVYVVLSSVNKMIIRVRKIDELFNESCNIAVNKGQYSMVWIGMVDQERKGIKPVAWNDKARDYIKGLIVPLDKNDGNLGTVGKAILENRHIVNNDIEIDESLGLRSAIALKMDLHSVTSFPLKYNSHIFGVISFYSEEKNHFDENEVRLLEELAEDISFSFYSIEQEKIRKLAELELKKLSRAIEQSPVSVLITNREGEIEYVNDKFCKVTGLTKKEAVGKNPRIIKSGFQDKKFYEQLWKTILSGKDWEGEMQNKKQNGDLYWESAIISPLHNNNGDITHFIAIKEDITEKKKMINDLVKAKEKAEEMNRLKSSFLSSMSHELRTPLIGILGYAEFLETELNDKKLIEMANVIKLSGNRLNKTLNNILDIAKIESENQQVVFNELDLLIYLNEQTKLFRKSAEDKNLLLNFESEQSELIAYIDEGLFVSIIANLLNNAIKYTERGSITLFAKKEGDYAVIEVMDTGLGVPEELQGIIFEPFRQASEGYSRKFEGTGLGLSLVKRYTDLMNGTITLKSKPGIGSTFTLRLPVDKNVSEKIIDTNWG
jgi:PAS domain S-box-containing protein